MPALVPSAAIAAAAARIEGVARHTPLVELPVEVGGPVYAKCENLQAGGAFKIRGAYNFIARLDGAAAGPGVITNSSGNHAQAVALAARRRGLAAVVVMPTTAPAVKGEGARQLGAEVHFEGTTSIDRKRRAEALAEEDAQTALSALLALPRGVRGLDNGVALTPPMGWLRRGPPHPTPRHHNPRRGPS